MPEGKPEYPAFFRQDGMHQKQKGSGPYDTFYPERKAWQKSPEAAGCPAAPNLAGLPGDKNHRQQKALQPETKILRMGRGVGSFVSQYVSMNC